MSFCVSAMVAAKNAVAAPIQAISDKVIGARANKKMQPRDHVNSGGHHGGGVDQRAHRRRPGHGIRQPDKERDLRGFAGGADEKQQSDQRR